MMYFVVEMNSCYDKWFGVGKGCIIVDGPLMCYRVALKKAIIHQRERNLKTYVLPDTIEL